MPKGPKGQKRPADVIGAAVMVGKIATGEVVKVEKKQAAAELGRMGGLKGVKARAKQVQPEAAIRSGAGSRKG